MRVAIEGRKYHPTRERMGEKEAITVDGRKKMSAQTTGNWEGVGSGKQAHQKPPKRGALKSFFSLQP
jgi:hypothetical protein